jgi:hypothetical protein
LAHVLLLGAFDAPRRSAANSLWPISLIRLTIQSSSDRGVIQVARRLVRFFVAIVTPRQRSSCLATYEFGTYALRFSYDDLYEIQETVET